MRADRAGDFDQPEGVPGELGRAIDWTPPRFPVCTVNPTPIQPGGFGVVQARGFASQFDRGLLNQAGGVQVFLGSQVVGDQHSHVDSGTKCIRFKVPDHTTDGLHPLTVTVDGTALTADCVVEVSSNSNAKVRDENGTGQGDCEDEDEGDVKREPAD
jgi:hypothetical protein